MTVAATQLPELQRGQDEDDLTEAGYSTTDRVAMAKAGVALPVRNQAGEIVGGRYPIKTRGDVENAVTDFDRSGGGEPEKAHIVRNAKLIGATDALPDGWAATAKPPAKPKPANPDKAKKSSKKAAVKERRKHGEAGRPTALRIEIREGLTKTGSAYEATILHEGPGNPEDKNRYTREALKNAVRRGLFEGLQAYANHPTPAEERERPERDVRQLVGHFREARYVENGGQGEVRAKFVPIHGPGYEWVTSLIESALNAPPGKPLIGISIDGQGVSEPAADGWNDIREIHSLGSADLVTRAGAGGEFHRRLSESLVGTKAPAKRAKLTARQAQKRVRRALAQLREAASCESGETLPEVGRLLREVETAQLRPPRREVKLRERLDVLRDQRSELRQRVKAERKRRKLAEHDGIVLDRLVWAARALEDVPGEFGDSWFPDLIELADEASMRHLVERRLTERRATIAELREANGLGHVEGNPGRLPSIPAPAGRSLADALGIDADELRTR